MNSGAEIFFSIENGQLLLMKYMANDETPERADSKNCIFIFLPNFGSRLTGLDRQRAVLPMQPAFY